MGSDQSKRRQELLNEIQMNLPAQQGYDLTKHRLTDLNNDSLRISFEQYYGLLFTGHETFVSEGGETDLQKKSDCKKNPGHRGFIPASEFSMQHLPRQCRNEMVYQMVRDVSDLTVKINVNVVSPYRPEFWPDTHVPYLSSNLKGKKCLRTGTGRVLYAIKYADGYDENGEANERRATRCACYKCKRSASPSAVWWEVVIWTATHVVFDEAEAGGTTCRLFEDGAAAGSSSRGSMAMLHDFTVDFAYVKEDWCQFRGITCDLLLGEKLNATWKRFGYLWKKISQSYRTLNRSRMTFIVSHPHGCTKQISIGVWKDKIQVDSSNDLNWFTYTTTTCPGSSGAPVYFLGQSGWGYHVHSGALKSGLNYSGLGFIPH